MKKRCILLLVFLATFSPLSCALNKSKILRQEQLVGDDSWDNIVIRKSPADKRSYAALKLANNLQVLLISDPTIATSAATLSVGAGYAQDSDSQPGLAHYLEHVILLNSKRYPEVNGLKNFLAARGYNLKGTTGAQETNYSFMSPAKDFGEAIDRFSDLFAAPVFDPELADKERQAVHNEWSLQRKSDAAILAAIDSLTINPLHPLSRMSIGNLETLTDKENSNLLQETKDFYQKYYSASNMRLTLVGSQSLALLRTYAKLYFSALPNSNIASPRITQLALTASELGKEIHYRPIGNMRSIYIDLPIQLADEQWALKAKEYLTAIVGSEAEGTLFGWLRIQGFAERTSLSILTQRFGRDGYLRVNISLTATGLQQSDKVIAATFSYLDLIKEKGIQKLLFDEQKSMAEKEFLNFKNETSFNAMARISSDQFIYPIEHIIDGPYSYNNFNGKSIAEFFEKWQPENARLWYINSNEIGDTPIPHYEGSYSIKDIPQEKISRWKSAAQAIVLKLPEANDLFSPASAPLVASSYQKPRQLISEPGVEGFLVHPPANRSDQGKITLELNTDINYKSAKNYMMAAIIKVLVQRKNTSLISRAKNAGISVEITSENESSLAFTLSGYTGKQTSLLGQLLDSIKNLQVSRQEFEDARQIVKKNQDIKNHVVIQQLNDALDQIQYAAPLNRQESFLYSDKLKFNDFKNYYEKLIDRVLLRVFISGNFSEDQAVAIALQAKTILPSLRKPQDRTIEKYFTPKKNHFTEIKAVTSLNDSGVVDAYIADTSSIKDRATLAILDRLMVKDFYTQLRALKQLGYIVTVGPIATAQYNGYKFGVQSSTANSTRLLGAITDFKKQYLATLESVDAETIGRIKLNLKMEKNSNTYKNYRDDFLNGIYTFDSSERYLSEIDAVTQQDLVALYQDLILNNLGEHIQLQIKGKNHADN